MRVTPNGFSDSLITQLNVLTARQYQLQNQVSSGQRIQAPADDPAAMMRVLGSGNRQGFSPAIQREHLHPSKPGHRLLQRDAGGEKNLGQGGGNSHAGRGTRSPQELKSYAAEVTQMIQQAAQLMNSKDSASGEYLFGGTQSDQPPFSVTTDPNGIVTAVNYQGNTTVANREIGSGVTLSVDVPGENNSGSGPRGLVSDSRSGADFFNHLISLQNNLMAGDTAAISTTDAPNLPNDEENFLFHVSQNGSVQTRLDTAAPRQQPGRFSGSDDFQRLQRGSHPDDGAVESGANRLSGRPPEQRQDHAAFNLELPAITPAILPSRRLARGFSKNDSRLNPRQR